MSEVTRSAATWKRVTASLLDFFTIFLIGGYAIAIVTGSRIQDGFNLEGGPALALLASIVIYFYIGRRYAGGTLWDRIFSIKRPQPN
jgi:hypothetical protein